MNYMAPDLSDLVPYLIGFTAIAVLGAIVSLVIIGHAVAAFVSTHRNARVAARPRAVIA